MGNFSFNANSLENHTEIVLQRFEAADKVDQIIAIGVGNKTALIDFIALDLIVNIRLKTIDIIDLFTAVVMLIGFDVMVVGNQQRPRVSYKGKLVLIIKYRVRIHYLHLSSSGVLSSANPVEGPDPIYIDTYFGQQPINPDFLGFITKTF